MGQVHYMISEAAKRVEVETHVLRYWEEELNLPIERTEMGHRYYTEEDIQLFCCIKELKDQGVLLKELKSLIPDIRKTKEQLKIKNKEKEKEKEVPQTIAVEVSEVIKEDNLEQVRTLIGQVLREVVVDNNKLLSEEVGKSVSGEVKKELNYLMQAKEQVEEDRYKKLDRLIRQQQVIRKENSKSNPGRLLRQMLGVEPIRP
ncbi:helix-turn-helix domain-containing protein [Lachnospiraceae bacterium LCP25S3_G4]